MNLSKQLNLPPVSDMQVIKIHSGLLIYGIICWLTVIIQASIMTYFEGLPLVIVPIILVIMGIYFLKKSLAERIYLTKDRIIHIQSNDVNEVHIKRVEKIDYFPGIAGTIAFYLYNSDRPVHIFPDVIGGHYSKICEWVKIIRGDDVEIHPVLLQKKTMKWFKIVGLTIFIILSIAINVTLFIYLLNRFGVLRGLE